VKWLLSLLILLPPVLIRAEGERELREAITSLAGATHAWETTSRQRFRGETTEPRVAANPPVAVRGKFDPEGYIEITQLASREVPAPIAAVFLKGDVVAHTPLGWLRRGELRQTPGPDREVLFEGGKVRLSRFLGSALKVTAMRPLLEEIFDLVADAKSFRQERGLVIAELRDQTIEKLWGDAQATRAPELHGTVIFKLGPEGLSEYHVVLGIGFPNSRTKTIAWSMQQWSNRITGVGTTRVSPPSGAVQALKQ
jgi:hypothetical protein